MSTKKKSTKQFIEEAKNVHGDKYDYSRVEYINQNTDVIIGCPVHGWFKQKPKQHVLRKHGCPKCGLYINKKKNPEVFKGKKHIYYTTDSFKKRLNDIFGDLYDLSKVEYNGAHKKVTIICKKHGEFERYACELLKGNGCPKCSREKNALKGRLGKEAFIEKANKVFHGIYDYSNVVYVNNATKIEIQCKKHGSFLCTPQNHLHGRGCPICKSESYVYEERLYNFLKTIFDEKEIIRQYRTEWLSDNKSLDFFIPKYNIGIEHQGSQHYYLTRYKGDSEEKLSKRIENDKVKYKECVENGVNLLYFTYELTKKPDNCFHELIFNEEELKEKLINKL